MKLRVHMMRGAYALSILRSTLHMFTGIFGDFAEFSEHIERNNVRRTAVTRLFVSACSVIDEGQKKKFKLFSKRSNSVITHSSDR